MEKNIIKKDCNNCQYRNLSYNEYPCSECGCTGVDHDEWLPGADYYELMKIISLEEKMEENKFENLKKLAGVDNVNHPQHYCREDAMECIDEMILIFGKEAVKNFCLCNAWKYRYRAADKNGEEDIKKSDWYIKKYKELNEEPIITTSTITLPYNSTPDISTTPWYINESTPITCTSYNTTGEIN